jgi:hypothetical protein
MGKLLPTNTIQVHGWRGRKINILNNQSLNGYIGLASKVQKYMQLGQINRRMPIILER